MTKIFMVLTAVFAVISVGFFTAAAWTSGTLQQHLIATGGIALSMTVFSLVVACAAHITESSL